MSCWTVAVVYAVFAAQSSLMYLKVKHTAGGFLVPLKAAVMLLFLSLLCISMLMFLNHNVLMDYFLTMF